MPDNDLPQTSYRPAPPERVYQVARSELPWLKGGGRPLENTARKLIVGHGITVAGEIGACEHLVVEGRIEAKLKECKNLAVVDGGVFKGSADVEMAEVAGAFDGDLTVHGRLVLRGAGTIVGTVRYGELQIEPGGRISGAADPLQSVVTAMPPPRQTDAAS